MRREERARLRSARDDRSERAGRAATSASKNSSQDAERAWRQRGEGSTPLIALLQNLFEKQHKYAIYERCFIAILM